MEFVSSKSHFSLFLKASVVVSVKVANTHKCGAVKCGVKLVRSVRSRHGDGDKREGQWERDRKQLLRKLKNT